MEAQGWFARRIDPTQFTGGVALGDLVAIPRCVVVGQYQHGGAPLARPAGVFEAAAPFYVAWIAVALVAGLYTLDATVSPRRAVSWSIPTWIVAVPISLAIRAVALPGNASLVFAAVSTLFGGLLVVGWRTAVPVLAERFRY
jgi:Flp pilus assembly pilin Flp